MGRGGPPTCPEYRVLPAGDTAVVVEFGEQIDRAVRVKEGILIGLTKTFEESRVAEVRDTVAQYRAIGVDELIVPDFTLGAMPQKIATLDRFIREVAGR